MANPSFAEIKERFNKMNVLPYPKPRSSSTDNDASSDSTASEKLKNDNGNVHPRSVTPNPLSQTSKETASLLETKLIQSRPNPTNSMPPKKAPVPLPRVVISHQNEKTSTELSSISQSSVVSQVVQLPVIPSLYSQPEENTYMEVISDFSDPSYSSDISDFSTSRSGDQTCFPIPIPLIPNRSKISHNDSASVSLDTLLPTKCRFFEFESVINGYRRRESRMIIYPKVKPSMPKITSDEINTLQRYSNT